MSRLRQAVVARRPRPPEPGGRWEVGPVRTTTSADGWHGIEADVDGTPLRIEARDVALVPRPEAIATAVAPAAMAAGVRLAVAGRVDPTWVDGVEAATRLITDWRETPRGRPLLDVRTRRDATPPVAGRGLCFTGGVDSFFALHHGDVDPTHLLYVLGYDVPLTDAERGADQLATLEAVAAATGTTPLAVRTNLRTHPVSAHVLWGWHHGAAIAAVGHALSGVVGSLTIPPSYADGRLIPFGSRPDLDPLWSRRGFTVRHCSTPKPRVERVRDLADDPLVHAHLHVCWEHLADGANCGRCEKCLRTMTMLAGMGTLDRVRTFPPIDLAAGIEALGSLPPDDRRMWGDLLELPLPGDVHGAIRVVLDA